MIVTTWILFGFFTMMSVLFTWKFLTGSKLNWLEMLILFFAVFVVAITAGMLFGGLTLL